MLWKLMLYATTTNFTNLPRKQLVAPVVLLCWRSGTRWKKTCREAEHKSAF
ncbi:hypothetical protein P879_03372 [Paragonimus westermani]|uniref:Uncharacterized protein n=1 Tax=Paragonimus westermani TaxID=34504 RepID=A0A8T0DKM7_9TREM|nr:hypothetical protein P879_03372 [Paragonimus westermani]